ncbi:MAG: BMC domain-containing protein [Oscillospiraceae bacterium]
MISKPAPVIYEKLGLDCEGVNFSKWSIGIMKFTPWEAALISSNIALQSGEVELGFVDRFMGTLVITGSITAVTCSIESVVRYCRDTLGFHVARITKN